MLSKTIEAALNEQILVEGSSSFKYLAMAAWCEREGLAGCATFLHRQSDEERQHMIRLFRYLGEMDVHAITPAIPQPKIEYASVQEVFAEVYASEKAVTSSIARIVDLCYQERDHLTLNFLQWYLSEQREEENLARGILDRIRLIGEGGQSLYYIDKELDKINRLAAAKEATEPEEGDGGA